MVIRVLGLALAFCLGAVVQAVHDLAGLAVIGIGATAWLIVALATVGVFRMPVEDPECWFCQEPIDADEVTCPYCDAAQC